MSGFITQKRKRFNHDWPWMVAFIIPALLVVVVIQGYPLLFSAYLATQEWTLTDSQGSEGFIGLENFRKVLQNEVFRRAVRNSMVITGSAVLSR